MRCDVVGDSKFFANGSILPTLCKAERCFHLLRGLRPRVSKLLLTYALPRSNACTYMIGTVLVGMYMHRVGREQTIMIGMVFNLIQQAGLYWTLGLTNAYVFLFFSFVFQLIGGFGSGMNSVATLAIVVSSSKDSEREMNIGMIEMATGIGFLVGPMWGSLMYHMGGFTLPFGSMSKCLCVISSL